VRRAARNAGERRPRKKMAVEAEGALPATFAVNRRQDAVRNIFEAGIEPVERLAKSVGLQDIAARFVEGPMDISSGREEMIERKELNPSGRISLWNR